MAIAKLGVPSLEAQEAFMQHKCRTSRVRLGSGRVEKSGYSESRIRTGCDNRSVSQ